MHGLGLGEVHELELWVGEVVRVPLVETDRVGVTLGLDGGLGLEIRLTLKATLPEIAPVIDTLMVALTQREEDGEMVVGESLPDRVTVGEEYPEKESLEDGEELRDPLLLEVKVVRESKRRTGWRKVEGGDWGRKGGVLGEGLEKI